MADKNALERIGLMLFAATLFVFGVAGVAVHHQLTTQSVRADMVEVAQLPGPLAALTPQLALQVVK
jgi:hypothetical protein